MGNWQSADMSAFVPSELTSLINTAQTSASSASVIMDTIKAAVELAKNFLVALPPFDFASALVSEIEQFKTDFGATGIYMLNMWDYPLVQFNRGGVGEDFEQSFETDVTEAFFDTRDPNVPPFNNDVAALILVGSAESISLVVDLLRVQKDSFTWWSEIESIYNRLTRVDMEVKVKETQDAVKRGDIKISKNPSEQTIQLLALNQALQQAKDDIEQDAFETNIQPFVPTSSSSAFQIQQYVEKVSAEVANAPYPNFEQTSLRTIIPALQELFDRAFEPLAAALATGRSIIDTIDAFIETLELKISALDGIVTTINNILDQLDNLLSNTTLSALFVESSNGMQGLADEIQNAGSKPPAGFYSGIVVIAGGPNVTAFKNLFGPIGGA